MTELVDAKERAQLQLKLKVQKFTQIFLFCFVFCDCIYLSHTHTQETELTETRVNNQQQIQEMKEKVRHHLPHFTIFYMYIVGVQKAELMQDKARVLYLLKQKVQYIVIMTAVFMNFVS